MQQKVTVKIGGNEISIETGKIARLADGAVIVTCGDTTVLVSAVSALAIKEGQDFFPLTVDYREKAAAVGKFPGGYFKREGRPSEKETLTSRMIDRPLRPLFPQGYFYRSAVYFGHSFCRPDWRGARWSCERPVRCQPNA